MMFQCIWMGVKQRGFRGALKQLFAMGEIKLGTLKGQDEHGNMYYENLNYQFGIRLIDCIYGQEDIDGSSTKDGTGDLILTKFPLLGWAGLLVRTMRLLKRYFLM